MKGKRKKIPDALLNEWDRDKNVTPESITNFNLKVWWKCTINSSHVWEASIANRIRGTKCPYCTKRKVSEINSLTKHQHLINEWDYDKNHNLNPKDVSEFSSKRVWWKCGLGHTWIALVSSRTAGNRCPYCFGDLASPEYNLLAQFPLTASEWNFNKNTLRPENYLPFSKKKVWWICSKNHEWEAAISDRTLSGSQCHVCSGYVNYKRSSYNEDKSCKTCNSCGLSFTINEFRIRSKKGHGHWINSICKSCESKKVEQYRTMTKEGIAAEIIRRKKNFCKSKKIQFDLDKDWILHKLDSINWCCELTGIPMKTLKTNMNEKFCGFKWDSISLDRIDPKNGYTKNNVRFVINQVNIFRQNGTDERMYEIAEALLKNRKLK